jgi:hypothetical protein
LSDSPKSGSSPPKQGPAKRQKKSTRKKKKKRVRPPVPAVIGGFSHPREGLEEEARKNLKYLYTDRRGHATDDQSRPASVEELIAAVMKNNEEEFDRNRKRWVTWGTFLFVEQLKLGTARKPATLVQVLGQAEFDKGQHRYKALSFIGHTHLLFGGARIYGYRTIAHWRKFGAWYRDQILWFIHTRLDPDANPADPTVASSKFKPDAEIQRMLAEVQARVIHLFRQAGWYFYRSYGDLSSIAPGICAILREHIPVLR